jgi:hypothetical protein
VEVSLAIGVAPVADLAGAAAAGIGGDSTAMLMRTIGPYVGLASPQELLPLGVPQVLASAADDEQVPAAYVAGYAQAALRAGDQVTEIDPGGGHFGVLDPGGEPWAKVISAAWPG